MKLAFKQAVKRSFIDWCRVVAEAELALTSTVINSFKITNFWSSNRPPVRTRASDKPPSSTRFWLLSSNVSAHVTDTVVTMNEF